MRVIICGGRDFTDVLYAVRKINKFNDEYPITTLICGMATGADTIGLEWARVNGIPVEEYPAEWTKYGKSAGPVRNVQMLEEGQPDAVLGLPGNKGTRHMLEISRTANIPVVEYSYLYFTKEDPLYGFLSNFYGYRQTENSIVYKTNEHYYQSKKTLIPEEILSIINENTPFGTKKRGRYVTIRPDWESIKVSVMMDGLRLKFVSGTDLSERLIATDDKYLVEYAPWGDTFWGVDKNYKGENYLGRLLMGRKDELITYAMS
jgi:ribA/ribD-fused uncharacterized protein